MTETQDKYKVSKLSREYVHNNDDRTPNEKTIFVLTQEQREEIGELVGNGWINEEIVDYFGICRNTFESIIKRDKAVGALYKKGKLSVRRDYEKMLKEKASGKNGLIDATSVIFFLKTKGGYRTADSIEHIATGNTDKYYPPEMRDRYYRMIELDKICSGMTLDQVKEVCTQYKSIKRFK